MAGRSRLFRRTLCAVAGVSVSLAGCAPQDAYRTPQFAFLKSYAGARTASPLLLQNADWWRRLNDPTLDALILRGLADGLTLARARDRVIEARATLQAVPGAAMLTPTAGVQAQGTDGSRDSEAEARLGFDWMLDPYGGRRALLASTGAQIDLAAAELDAARLLLLFNIANTYVDLRYSQRLLQLRRQELRSREQTLALITALFDQNSAIRVDVVRAQALVAETRATLPRLQADIQSRKNELAVLVGMQPGTLDIELDLGAVQPRPRMPADIGIPADLLRNRPDIRIAERSYYGSVADIGAARADLYPQLSLGGAITLTALRGAGSTEYFFGPALRFPALGSHPQARVTAREARARQAQTSWKATVLQAILEVENALVQYSASLSAVQSSEKTVRLYREVVDLTKELITSDGATIRDLIDAEQSIAAADTTLSENLRVLSRNFITLNVSLGSGSSYSAAPPETSSPVALHGTGAQGN